MISLHLVKLVLLIHTYVAIGRWPLAISIICKTMAKSTLSVHIHAVMQNMIAKSSLLSFMIKCQRLNFIFGYVNIILVGYKIRLQSEINYTVIT